MKNAELRRFVPVSVSLFNISFIQSVHKSNLKVTSMRKLRYFKGTLKKICSWFNTAYLPLLRIRSFGIGRDVLTRLDFIHKSFMYDVFFFFPCRCNRGEIIWNTSAHIATSPDPASHPFQPGINCFPTLILSYLTHPGTGIGSRRPIKKTVSIIVLSC